MSKQESKIRQAVKEAEDAQQRQNEAARFEFQSSIGHPGCRVGEIPPSPLNHDERKRLQEEFRYKAAINVVCAILSRVENGEGVINEALDPLLKDIPCRPGALKLLESVLDEWVDGLKDSLKKPS